jgi:chromosome segregation ATPase
MQKNSDSAVEQKELTEVESTLERKDILLASDRDELHSQVRFLSSALDAARRDAKELSHTLERERRMNAETRLRFERQFAALSDQLLQMSRLQRESEAVVTRLQMQLAEAKSQERDAREQLMRLQREMDSAIAQADWGKRALASLSEKETLMHETAKNNACLRDLVGYLEGKLKQIQCSIESAGAATERGFSGSLVPASSDCSGKEMRTQIERMSAALNLLRDECVRAKEESSRLRRDVELLHRLVEEQQRTHITTETLLCDRYTFMRNIATALSEQLLSGSLSAEHETEAGTTVASDFGRESASKSGALSAGLRRTHSV